jgi:hypothetical protein
MHGWVSVAIDMAREGGRREKMAVGGVGRERGGVSALRWPPGRGCAGDHCPDWVNKPSIGYVTSLRIRSPPPPALEAAATTSSSLPSAAKKTTSTTPPLLVPARSQLAGPSSLLLSLSLLPP